MIIYQKDLDRFWAKVDKSGDCWEWTAYRDKDGYGKFCFRKEGYAHRFSWLLHFGDIPGGILVCHHCDNPGCVNPGHLFLGTNKDNIQDAMKKGRMKFPRKRGEDNGLSKLTEKQVLEIREEYKTGQITQTELAKKYNVSHVAIWHVVKRKTWTHI